MPDDVLLYGTDDRPFKSIEQAWNLMKDRYKAMKKKIIAEARQQPITIAPPEDRERYLGYCISLLKEVDEDLMRLMPVNIRTIHSNREMADFFRWFLMMKVRGASDKYMAKKTGVPIEIIHNIEIYAQEAVFRAVKKAKATGLPIVGCS